MRQTMASSKTGRGISDDHADAPRLTTAGSEAVENTSLKQVNEQIAASALQLPLPLHSQAAQQMQFAAQYALAAARNGSTSVAAARLLQSVAPGALGGGGASPVLAAAIGDALRKNLNMSLPHQQHGLPGLNTASMALPPIAAAAAQAMANGTASTGIYSPSSGGLFSPSAIGLHRASLGIDAQNMLGHGDFNRLLKRHACSSSNGGHTQVSNHAQQYPSNNSTRRAHSQQQQHSAASSMVTSSMGHTNDRGSRQPPAAV